ncbi:glutathione synthase/RimK-type ligase-like ATP-grasp enzyme [Sphingomonas kaistensis]|uniref:Glutathione synthase/RimK-type ligase-like ATP-grasp enzyme n=1 Tax=Sphingomonas kaistensis TaxID=298708 RepID=A0A7X6BGS9_9SPHN|nr:alpha-L-glutamate ligase [Sphingomonas kaistensis]NJC05391.1 glutathione synthase/RimK-type ligase-like ATP-grasp enzyme [Sphingomonas kaistensis]
MPELALLYEHPLWFEPLFAALDRSGVDYVKIAVGDHHFDPAGSPPPAPVIFNRVAMSSFLREPEHPLFYTAALLDHWRGQGALVLNGPEVMAIDSSKARQLSLLGRLGLTTPRTRVVHRAADLAGAAEEIGYPLLVKANVGGSGAGIMRFDSAAELAAVVAAGDQPRSVDQVLLVQEAVPARDGMIWRIETLDARFLYALEIAGAGQFDLCPADACGDERGPIAMRAFTPPAEIVAGAERVAQAMGMDVGGVEVMIDSRDGSAKFYDINALSNFVAKPTEVLGYDPHDNLVDWLKTKIAEARA